MFAAKNMRGQLCYAAKISNGSQDQMYYCPRCGQAVYLKQSPRGKNYFAHYQACGQAGSQARQVQESRNHHRGKELLYYSLPSADYHVDLEYSFDDLQQIADVYVRALRPRSWRSGVLEYQQTPISAACLQRRQQHYLTAVDRCDWFTDAVYLERDLLERWRLTLTQHHPDWGYYQAGIDLTNYQLVIDYQLPLVLVGRRYQLQRMRCSLPGNLSAYLEGELTPQGQLRWQHASGSSRRSPTATLKQLMLSSHYRRPIRELYEHGVILQSLPESNFIQRRHYLFLQEPGWLVLAWLYVFLKKQSDFCGLEWDRWCQYCVAEGRFGLLNLPLLDHDYAQDMNQALLADVQALGWISLHAPDQWRSRVFEC